MRTLLRFSTVIAIAIGLLASWGAGPAVAGEDTITLKLYPRTAHEKVWGVVVPWGEPETLTVREYRIFDTRGDSRDHILLETGAGVTRLLFDNIRRIDFMSYPRIYHFNKRMASVRYVVRATIFLTDGSRIENAIVNAYWGHVEGDTELGRFYLEDPLSVASITFNSH